MRLAERGPGKTAALGTGFAPYGIHSCHFRDYAVMERSTNVAVLPCDIGWSDLGSLDALYDYYRRSAETTRHPVDHNISVAGKDPVYIDAQRNMVISRATTGCPH